MTIVDSGYSNAKVNMSEVMRSDGKDRSKIRHEWD